MDMKDFQLMLEKTKLNYEVDFDALHTRIVTRGGKDHMLVVNFDEDGRLINFDFEMHMDTECEACGRR